MPQYEGYQLANSQRTRPFVGSVLPELTSVAGKLQERFEMARSQDDLIDQAIKTSIAGPFEGDKTMLEELKAKMRGRMQERAQKGNYEDMYRETLLDARDFMNEYKPIAENAQRYEAYKQQLNEALAKGTIKSPGKVQRLLAASLEQYRGLQRDPATGAITNQFSGMAAVKDIDPTEKIDKWMKDVAPTILGTRTQFTDGVWRRFKEGKWVMLTPQEINSVMDAGRRLDPEFDAWLQQEKQLAGVGLANDLDDASVYMLPQSEMRYHLINEMKRTGRSARTILRDLQGAETERTILGNMRQYANKYIRDDKETGSGIMGADEYNLQRTGKKLEDETLVLSMPILQPEQRVEIKGAENLRNKIGEAGKNVQAVREQFDNWVRTKGLVPDGKGNWRDAQGNDMTLKYLEQQQMYRQAQQQWQELTKLDAEARKRTGYGQGTVTPELIKQAEKAAEKAVVNSRKAIGPGGAPHIPSETADAALYERTKNEYLRTNSPGYKQYDEMLKSMTQKGSQLVNIQTFNSIAANKQAEHLFKSLAVNLDGDGLKSGTQGLQWASGEAAGENLIGDDYQKVRDNAVFAGYGMDTDGQLKYYYKVGEVKTTAAGKSTGEEALVKIPALPGTAEILIKNKQMEPAQLMLGQQINNTINKANGAGYIKVDGQTEIYIDRIDKTEIGNGEVSAGINIRFPKGDGTYTEVRTEGIGDAINTISNALRARAAREQQQKKK